MSKKKKKIIITEHAYDRARERAGLKDESLNRLAKKILEKGISHADTAGNLRKFLDCLYLSQKKANNIKIYGEKVYLFHNTILITMINLPNEFKTIVNKIKKEKNGEVQE